MDNGHRRWPSISVYISGRWQVVEFSFSVSTLRHSFHPQAPTIAGPSIIKCQLANRAPRGWTETTKACKNQKRDLDLVLLSRPRSDRSRDRRVDRRVSTVTLRQGFVHVVASVRCSITREVGPGSRVRRQTPLARSTHAKVHRRRQRDVSRMTIVG